MIRSITTVFLLSDYFFSLLPWVLNIISQKIVRKIQGDTRIMRQIRPLPIICFQPEKTGISLKVFGGLFFAVQQ